MNKQITYRSVGSNTWYLQIDARLAAMALSISGFFEAVGSQALRDPTQLAGTMDWLPWLPVPSLSLEPGSW